MKYVNKPFDRLPLKKRAVFILRLAGFTYKEIIALMIVSPNFIKLAETMACKENYFNGDSKFEYTGGDGVVNETEVADRDREI